MSGLARVRLFAHWGIRGRVATLTTAIVAVTVILGALAVVLLLKQSLVAGLDATQLARAETLAAQARLGSVPTLSSAPHQSSLVQILDSSGAVIASTADIEGQDAVLPHPPYGRRPVAATLADSPVGGGETFRVLAYPAVLHSGPGWIYVASSMTIVDDAVNNLLALFLAGLPIVLIIVGVVVWGAVASALRPVERIRRGAAAISAARLDHRLPVPASRDEIARLTATMNDLLARLETSAIRQRQFIGDAAHELRSPLAGVLAQVDVALEHPDAERSEQTLNVIHSEAERMSQLIDDLLYLAQRTEGAPQTPATSVDLDDLVLEEAKRLRERGGITIAVTVHAARVQGSARDLARALRNLSENAYEHARNHVEFRLRVVDGMAEVSVSDDGEGIPVERREEVFARFTRLDDARERHANGRGFGLGLSIAREIALAHHGTLTAGERQDGERGGVFLLRLPLSV